MPDPLHEREKQPVLLLKDADADDPYVQVLGEAGYDVRAVPVLRFVFVNQAALRDSLEHPTGYGGLIVTSPRAVEALAEVMPWLPSENVAWHSRPVYAVGPATAAALEKIGFTPQGADSGSAELLARQIIARSFERPLLFLCGNRRRDALPTALHAAGIAVEVCCVYETHVRDDLSAADLEGAGWLVFFSPSGLEAVQHLDLASYAVAAIGPTTAEALQNAGLAVRAVAAEPTPEALLAAVAQAGGRS